MCCPSLFKLGYSLLSDGILLIAAFLSSAMLALHPQNNDTSTTEPCRLTTDSPQPSLLATQLCIFADMCVLGSTAKKIKVQTLK
jgi:hypothetical protein